MTFLKKLGKVLAFVQGIFTGFAPVITANIPGSGGVVATVSQDLAQVAQSVVDVETIANLAATPTSGADKAKNVAPLVADVLLKSSILAGKKIANPALFTQGCSEIGGGMADVLNSLHEDSVNAVTEKVPGQ